ncbi:MAG: hypothetical protein QM500_16060 [Methylococcales bacterium]
MVQTCLYQCLNNSKNKNTRKKIKGLKDQVDKHNEKIKNDPDGRTVPHWESEIDAFQDQIDKLKKRLPGKQCK